MGRDSRPHCKASPLYIYILIIMMELHLQVEDVIHTKNWRSQWTHWGCNILRKRRLRWHSEGHLKDRMNCSALQEKDLGGSGVNLPFGVTGCHLSKVYTKKLIVDIFFLIFQRETRRPTGEFL